MHTRSGSEAISPTAVRGRVHFHQGDAYSTAAELVEAGFGRAVLHRPDAFRHRLVRILEARMQGSHG